MRIISKILDKVCFAAKVICAILFAVMLTTSLAEIVRRYIFGLSFPWADELIRYCIAGVASIGGASCYHEIGGLVSFDLLQINTHGKKRLALELFINTVVLIFASYMFKNSLDSIMLPSVKNQISIGLGISMVYPYMFLVIGMLILILLSLEKYYKIFVSYRDGVYEKRRETTLEKGGDV